MTPALERDLARLDALLGRTLDDALATLGALHQRPVARAPAAPAPEGLDDAGDGFDAALARFHQRFAPGFSASAGPRYLGFVTGGATPAALAGDWLASVWDQNPTSGLDSTAPDLERETLGCLRELFGLPGAFDGAFVTGATMSNFVGLAIAREWLGDRLGVQVARDGVAALGPVRILSGAPHSSVSKAAAMLGLGRDAVQAVPLLRGREAVDPDALASRLAAPGGAPCIVVANAGTVNTGDFDDLRRIAALRERHPFWLHVDAAFGGFAAACPELAHLVDGLALADSICIDAHKWLNVPYDAAVQFSRRADLQLRVFMNGAAYLGAPGVRPDFVHLTPENSRRLRALPAWFALRAYGREGVREIVRDACRHAGRLGAMLDASAAFELLAPVRLNVACFALSGVPSGPGGEAPTLAFVRRVRDAGETFVTPTVLHGRWGIRAAFSNWRTRDEDVERVLRALEAAAATVG